MHTRSFCSQPLISKFDMNFVQALLANISAMYAVYHGPDGLKQIANRVHGLAAVLAAGTEKLGHKVAKEPFFDTIRIDVSPPLWLLMLVEQRKCPGQ